MHNYVKDSLVFFPLINEIIIKSCEKRRHPRAVQAFQCEGHPIRRKEGILKGRGAKTGERVQQL